MHGQIDINYNKLPKKSWINSDIKRSNSTKQYLQYLVRNFCLWFMLQWFEVVCSWYIRVLQQHDIVEYFFYIEFGHSFKPEFKF